MDFIVDPDVRKIAEFMVKNIQANRLVAVAKGVSDLAPLLWGHHSPEAVNVIRLEAPDCE